jgi:hypothetical protein
VNLPEAVAAGGAPVSIPIQFSKAPRPRFDACLLLLTWFFIAIVAMVLLRKVVRYAGPFS